LASLVLASLVFATLFFAALLALSAVPDFFGALPAVLFGFLVVFFAAVFFAVEAFTVERVLDAAAMLALDPLSGVETTRQLPLADRTAVRQPLDDQIGRSKPAPGQPQRLKCATHLKT